MHWQLQDAKNKLSQVVQQAKQDGPQVITVRGVEEVVVISKLTYQELAQQGGDLVDFLEHSPWAEMDLDVERLRDVGRDIEL